MLISVLALLHIARATCRRNAIDGEEGRCKEAKPWAAANIKSSVESDRTGKRREDVRTK